MIVRSLAMRSEVLALSGLSNLTAHDGYLVQSTPAEPDFWMGNQLILPDTTLTAPEAFAAFETHFPDATHRSVVWDIPGLDPTTIKETAALGCSIEGFDTLKLRGKLRDAPTPVGIVLRALDGADDWAQAEALQGETGEEECRILNRMRLIWHGAMRGGVRRLPKGWANGSAPLTGIGSLQVWVCFMTTGSRDTNPLKPARPIESAGFAARCCAIARYGRWAARRTQML